MTAFVAITLLNACKKDEEEKGTPKKEASVPTITINKPAASQHYHVGDTIFVSVTASDNDEMHNLKAWLIATEHKDTLWTGSSHTHGSKTVTLNRFYVVEEESSGGGHEHEEEAVNLVVLAENEAGKTATQSRALEIHYH